jgi:hypothetical protein
MKLFSTLIQRITAVAVVLAMAFGVNAAERTFATLADMHAATDLVDGDVVTITDDVVVEYIFESYYVLKDKSGTATCVNYNYNFSKFNKLRLEGVEEYPETPPVKPGDVFKNYTATVEFTYDMIQLKPELDMDWLEFVGFTVEYAKTTDYVTTTTKVTVRQLLDTPDSYIGKVVSLDNASTFLKGFSSYLVQGTDTLKNFRISGLNPEDYPNNIVINQAICLSKYGGGCKLELSMNDYEVGPFTELKALKSSAMSENIPLDLTVQVLRKEVYDGKTYITVMNGSGKYLLNYSGIRILLNTENDVDKNIKVGDHINIKTSTAKLSVFVKNDNGFTPSLLTLDAHETTIISSGEIKYMSIAPEEVSMLNLYEFLPVILNGYVTLSGEPTEEQIAHNIAPATLASVYGDLNMILLDLTYKPKEGSKYVVTGIMDVPLWMGVSNKTVIVPLSERGFMSDSYTFNNIEEMLAFGAPISSVVNYKFANPVTVTGIETIKAVGDEDQTQHVVFVADETASLMLRGVVSAKVGDAITAVSGYYNAGRSTTINDGFIDFGVAVNLELDSTGVDVATSGAIVVNPIDVTIAQLLSSDEYASKLVKLTDFTYKKVEEVVQDETVTRHFIYQGTDSMAVDASFEWQEDKSEIVGNYYLNGYYTSVIPVVKAKSPVAVDNIISDNTLFVANSAIYAQGAEIEVYDIMGRLITTGVDVVAIENVNQNIFVVRTKYFDGQVFITKVANR